MYLGLSNTSGKKTIHVFTILWKKMSVEIYNKEYKGSQWMRWMLHDSCSFTLSYKQAKTHYELDGFDYHEPVNVHLKKLGHIKTVEQFCDSYQLSVEDYKSLIKNKGDLGVAVDALTNIYQLTTSKKREEFIDAIKQETLDGVPDSFYQDISKAIETIDFENAS